MKPQILTKKWQNFFLWILEFFRVAWWVEIVTVNPCCIYYFGPFSTANHAKRDRDGYIEDLRAESATVIAVHLKRCQPHKLTVLEDELLDSLDSSIKPNLPRLARIYNT